MQHEVKKRKFSIDFYLQTTLALEYTPADQKSLYRRASAFEHLGKLNEAISDAQRLISISPKESSADEQTNALLRKLRENAQNKVHRRKKSFSFFFHFYSMFFQHTQRTQLASQIQEMFEAIRTKSNPEIVGEYNIDTE
jgi:tetratricopeptide (TPR) repeat protein